MEMCQHILSSPGFPPLCPDEFQSSSFLFHSKIPGNSNLAWKEEKIMSVCPHFLHTWWHWHDAHGAGAVQTGNGSTLLPGSCCPGAGKRLYRLLPALRVYLPLWNDGEEPKQEPRTRGSAATLVSSPPEHLGLAVLLSESLLPPLCGTALSCVPSIATAALQLSCACNLQQFSSAIPKAGISTSQRCCELSVSVGKCWGLLLCWTMSTHHTAPRAPTTVGIRSQAKSRITSLSCCSDFISIQCPVSPLLAMDKSMFIKGLH